MHATMPTRFLIRVSLCVFCLLTMSVLLVPLCMARGKYDPDPGERRGSDLPDSECVELGIAVRRITRDRANPDKHAPGWTDTAYRWYTDCPAGRIAWEHKKAQEKREQEERIAKYAEEQKRTNAAAVARISQQSLPSDYRAKIDRAFVYMLKDPDSRKIDYVGRPYGSAVCSTVNARNSFGGYTGRQIFLASFDAQGGLERLQIYSDDDMGRMLDNTSSEGQLLRQCGVIR